MNDDERIRDLLDEAHRSARVAPFERLWTGPAPRRPAGIRWLAAASAAAALGTTGVLVFRRPQVPAPAVPTAAAVPMSAALPVWRSPTDFLLETPGIAFLRETPRLKLDIPDYRKDVAR